ncbi:hypothetical protein FRP1_16500 [Pseudonocardia sp. EC080625-04]|uniref:PP2C family protein-serine/threonine phosphatase n=1 Tax=Pseudonocardia sp. EC080625-04 TaxID=1096868 RepID=UPI0006CB545D|nr:PP2C family protein-serine/threonine phosphatase [Pseudonocardia sp. EC080625-04]ALE74208.1 hypothetical protein FRP1_16500 [Pseudonocardia sp. EC080625-04]
MNALSTTCPADGGDHTACEAVCAPDRLAALAASGLSGAPDPHMQFHAEWVRTSVGVPLAAVLLVHPARLVVPGLAGGTGPAAPPRSVPLTRPVCRHAAELATAVVVDDARGADVLPALRTVAPGAVALAAAPLTDGHGHVLGALVVADDRPRSWDPDEIRTLFNVGRACSTDLRLRLSRQDAGIEIDRRDEIATGHRRAFDRSQMLLSASQVFTGTTTVDDVRSRIEDLLGEALDPALLTVVVTDERGGLQQFAPERTADDDPGPLRFAGSVLAAPDGGRRDGVQYFRGRAEFDREFPRGVRDRLRDLGLHSVVSVPLPSAAGAPGSLVLGWTTPDAVEPTDLLTIATIAGYAAQALARARRLDHRTAVAHEMQNAMLTTLPKIDGLPMAARYRPADSREYVGGDWYDVVPKTDPDRPRDDLFAVSVGDIVGHSVTAVTLMGQARSMLRQATWDNPGGPPTAILESFEAANSGLDLGAAGTTVVVHLRRDPAGRWSMTWVNAGHPPPVLLHPDGTAELLSEHDVLFGYDLAGPGARHDHHRDLAPGSTLFLYTDGLVEKRGSDLDTGTAALVELLEGVSDRSVDDIADIAVETLAPGADDDVVAFAIRFPPG